MSSGLTAVGITSLARSSSSLAAGQVAEAASHSIAPSDGGITLDTSLSDTGASSAKAPKSKKEAPAKDPADDYANSAEAIAIREALARREEARQLALEKARSVIQDREDSRHTDFAALVAEMTTIFQESGISLTDIKRTRSAIAEFRAAPSLKNLYHLLNSEYAVKLEIHVQTGMIHVATKDSKIAQALDAAKLRLNHVAPKYQISFSWDFLDT